MKQTLWHLSRTKKALLVFCALLFFLSSGGLLRNFYHENSMVFPAEGGSFTEGAVASIDQNFLLNPVFVTANTQANSVAAGITRLVFAGLMKFESGSGQIVDHLADHTLSEDKTTYTFTIKEGLTWHDGTPITSNDVLFTYKTVIQDPDFSNKLLQAAFLNVEISKQDEKTIVFTIPESYKFFLTNFTVGLLPAHILQDVPIAQLQFHEFNQNPVGAGPYRFGGIQFDENAPISTVSLEAFPGYILGKPKISFVNFKLYPNQEILRQNINELDSISPARKQNFEFLEQSPRFSLFHFTLPQYVAVFLNMDNQYLKGEEGKKTRLAFQLATDKEELLNILPAKRIDTPLLETDTSEWLFEFDPMKAQGALKDSGWILPNTTHTPSDDTETTVAPAASSESETNSESQNLQYVFEPSSQRLTTISSESSFIVGNVPEGTQKVQVNGYTLRLFSPSKGTFSYKIDTNIGTLKKGENTYTIDFFAADQSSLGTETITIFLGEEPSSPPSLESEGAQEQIEEGEESSSPESNPSISTETENEGTSEKNESTEATETEEISDFPEFIRQKESGEPLSFRFITVNTPQFYPEIAKALQSQWAQVGIHTTLEILSPQEFSQQAIQEKNYDLLLYSQNLGYNLDAFSFWHYSQAEQGVNLSKYKSFAAGVLLEEIRQSHDEVYRQEKLNELRELMKEDVPAVFLLSPFYTMPLNQKVQNVHIPHIALLPDRFADIEKWYIRESRGFYPEKNWLNFFSWFSGQITETLSF